MVATTITEVGVNVPNASVMIIENTERFGLPQLHQLRGRMGHGAERSCCILTTRYKLAKNTRKCLEIMVHTSDGFGIAEVGLKLRGLGDLEGTQQGGIALDLKIVDITRDGQLLRYIRRVAEFIVDKDPNGGLPENEVLWRQLKALRKTSINWAAISWGTAKHTFYLRFYAIKRAHGVIFLLLIVRGILFSFFNSPASKR